MRLLTTRAVVSKTMKMSDSSKLVTLITENHGLVKVMARGARRPQSKFGASLETITLISCIYSFRDNREIQNLSSSEIIEPYMNIKSDLTMLSNASAVLEITQMFTTQDDPKAGTFENLINSLAEFETGRVKNASKLLWRSVLRLLGSAGYSPQIDKCSLCGGKVKGTSVFFSFRDGGIVCSCSDTSEKFGVAVSLGALMVMKSLTDGTSGDLDRLKVSPGQIHEIEKLILHYISYHTGTSRQPKSLGFLRKIEN
jgi:DNA repair protein RecO (recombination protein O)